MSGLENAIGEVLEPIIELGGEGVDGIVDEGVKVYLQLLIRHADMEATSEGRDN